VSSFEQDDNADEVDGGEEVSRELIIARCNRSEVFECIEEPFDEIALAIEHKIAMPLDKAIGLGRDDRLDPPLLQGQDQAIGVISLVGEEGLRFDALQEKLCLAEVRGLARGQGEGDRIAQSIDEGVDFGGQSAPGASDGLVAAVFFRAPALCW
jgi:hypothetical protein